VTNGGASSALQACEWDEETCAAAAAEGHLELLQVRRVCAQLAAAPRTYCQIRAQRSMLCLGRIVRTSPRDPICARRP
jgi:hypothetical protein